MRDFVASKRRYSSRPNQEQAIQGFRGWYEGGRLPHRDEPGLTQFVTFHLADSFPEALRSEWEHLYQIEDDRARRAKLEAYLDSGRGESYLRRPMIARFWAADFFDTYVRDSQHERRIVRYIENNPTKPKLVLDPREWPWSSARRRDPYGRLSL